MSIKPGQEDIQYLIDNAIANGINFFDTADLYDKGWNEEMIGKALKNHRSNVIIATKVGNQWKQDGSGWTWNPRKEYILQAVENSLRRLDIDEIDLYQLHGGTIDDPIDETIEAFEILADQGKIRYYGISSIRPNVIREYVKKSNIVSVMMQYSLLDRRPEEEMLSYLESHNIGVLARGTVASGLLAGKPLKSYLDRNEEQIDQLIKAMDALDLDDRTNAQISMQYVLHNSAITSAIVGIRTPVQLVEAIDTIELGALDNRQYNTLAGAISENHYTDHR
jgi:aryl-alcohol dehydrogenase-like predicted oxidoreductase